MTSIHSALNSNNMDAFGMDYNSPEIRNAQQQSQPVYILVQPPKKTAIQDHYKNNYPPKLIKIISYLHLIVFSVSIFVQVLAVMFRPQRQYDDSPFFWCLFFGLAGSSGLLSALKTTTCSIVTFMVFNIFSSFMILPVFVIDMNAIQRLKRITSSDDYETGHFILLSIFGIRSFFTLVEVVILVTGFTACCRVLCCRSTKPQGPIIYNANATSDQNGEPIVPEPVRIPAHEVDLPMEILNPANESKETKKSSTQSQKQYERFP